MGVINKTTDEINTLLEKVEGMPEEGATGKTPVLETGTTATLPAGSQATSEVVANGTDQSGNPKYKLNFGIPRGADGAGGSGGGTADNVEWKNVLNKPTWVNSSTKPSYTAAEVGALPSTTTIPSKTSELDNDSKFVKSTELKTINGNSIVGSGNIEISGTGSGIADAPSDGQTYGRKNGAWAAITSGTGGSVDITDILTRLVQIANVGGTCTDEDYNTLKGYADNGTLTYINSDDTSLILNVKNLSGSIQIAYNTEGEDSIIVTVISISSSKQVTLSQKELLWNTNLGSGFLGEYAKPTSYSAISKSDSISTAIGKLEAGLGTSGGGSSNEYYILPNSVVNLDSSSTSEECINALGGEDKISELIDAVNVHKKKVFIISELISSPVSVYVGSGFLGLKYIRISFIYIYNISSDKFYIKDILLQRFSEKTSVLSITSNNPKGYVLSASVYNLNSSSSSEDISTAIGGESGIKSLIKAIKNNTNVYIGGEMQGSHAKVDLSIYAYTENENGDMSVSFGGFGYMIWGVSGVCGLMILSYTKSSNTFSISVIGQ